MNMTQTEMATAIRRVMEGAGGEAPDFVFMNLRDWWFLRRGPKWRYPLPKKRVFRPLRVEICQKHHRISRRGGYL